MLCKRLIALSSLFGLLALAVSGVGCSTARLTRYETSFIDVFDTVTQVVLYAPDEASASAQFAQIHNALSYYHRCFDIYHDDSEQNNLKAVNDAAGISPVAVDACVLELIQTAKRMYALTGGRMNIALGSVLSLWHDARVVGLDDPDHAALPNMELLQEAALHTAIDDVVVDEAAGTLYLADAALRLDVGAIAKGYAAERVAASAKARGVSAMLLNIGGNVRAVGTRPDGKPWQVAVQSPDGGAPVCTLSVAGTSLVTSGAYQRYYTVDGVRYHHIIDPATLLPADYFASVSVLYPDSAVADALSTALFCMPLEEGLALVESLNGAEALFLMHDGTQVSSSGFSRYVS